MAEFTSSDVPRIFLWCVPRSCSTAFTKMMSFVDGAEVWFEPYTACFFQKMAAENKAVADVMEKGEFRATSSGADMGNKQPMSAFSYKSTTDLLEGNPKNPDAKFIFVKDMAHAIHGMYDFLPQKVPWKYVFLIRHPHRFATSYLNLMRIVSLTESQQREIQNEGFTDLLLHAGRDQILTLWKHVRENIDPDPIVIDADDMLKKPGEILPRLFGRLGLPWKDSYLKWSEDKAITKTWISHLDFTSFNEKYINMIHGKAMSSSNFVYVEKPLPDIKDIHPEARKIVDMFMPGYEEMYKHALK